MSRTPPTPHSILFWRLLLGMILLAAWEWGARAGVLDSLFFGRPSIALRVLGWMTWGTIWPHLLTTLVEAPLAFAIGSLFGVVLGLALARAPFLAAVLDPYVRIANTLPRVVLAPMFLLWFGLGIWSKIALGVTVVSFFVFFNTYRGVGEVDRVMIDNVRMLGASEGQLIRRVLIPSALTSIFSSLHISIGLAIIAVVVGEYLAASRGIRYLIAQAEGVSDTTGVFAGIAVLSAGVLTVGAVGDPQAAPVRRALPARGQPDRAAGAAAEPELIDWSAGCGPGPL